MANYNLGKKLCRVAPQWKCILLMLVTSLSFMLYDWRFYLANLAITLGLSYCTNISYKQLGQPIASYFYLLVVVFGMHAIGGHWLEGIKAILRFCNMITFGSWILLTTSSREMIEGLTTLLKPLAYIGVKPAKVSLAFALAIRFMPRILDTFKEVKMAQQAKGIDKNFIATLIPSVIKTIKMADDIAEAIEARSWE